MDLLERLADAGQLLSQLHFQISSARKSFIAPILSKPMKELLQKTKPGTLLYGDKLTEKIKTAKAIEKIGKEIKNPTAAASTSNSAKRTPFRAQGRSLNWKGHFARPGTQHRGQKSFQSRTYPKTSNYSSKSSQSNPTKQTKTNQTPQNDKQ